MTKQWKKQATVAYGYALNHFALNCFLYFDEAGEPDANGAASCEQQDADSRFQGLLAAWLDGSLSLSETGAFREQLRHKMETIVAYTDCFQSYEYALNRMERRFDKTLPVSKLTEEEFVSQVMGFLTGAPNASEMNLRIQEVIGQLPVRFTKQKYYGMVRDALSAYIGSDSEALENVMYLLRTGAMAELTEDRKTEYPKLQEMLDTLANLSFKELTAESYQNAVQLTVLAGEMLTSLSGHCQMLQELANDLYLLTLTKEDAMRDTAQEAAAVTLLKALSELDGKAVPEELEAMLCRLEGVQEEYYEKYERLDPAPEYEPGEGAEAYCMRCVDRLMSASPFASLKENQQPRLIESSDIDRAVEEFVTLTAPLFSTWQKPVLRAVMATTLSTLPVCFNSLDEIQGYVKNSLGSCTDFAEKETCKELITQLMESEGYEVV